MEFPGQFSVQINTQPLAEGIAKKNVVFDDKDPHTRFC